MFFIVHVNLCRITLLCTLSRCLMTRWRVTNLRKHLQYFRYTTDRRDAEMPSSAVGDSVLIVNIVLTIVGSNPSAEWDWFFPLFFLILPIRLKRIFRVILHLHFPICRHFTSEPEIESLKGRFLCFNCGLNSNLHLVCLRFYAIPDTLSCKESISTNGNQQYVLFSRYFLLF